MGSTIVQECKGQVGDEDEDAIDPLVHAVRAKAVELSYTSMIYGVQDFISVKPIGPTRMLQFSVFGPGILTLSSTTVSIDKGQQLAISVQDVVPPAGYHPPMVESFAIKGRGKVMLDDVEYHLNRTFTASFRTSPLSKRPNCHYVPPLRDRGCRSAARSNPERPIYSMGFRPERDWPSRRHDSVYRYSSRSRDTQNLADDPSDEVAGFGMVEGSNSAQNRPKTSGIGNLGQAPRADNDPSEDVAGFSMAEAPRADNDPSEDVAGFGMAEGMNDSNKAQTRAEADDLIDDMTDSSQAQGTVGYEASRNVWSSSPGGGDDGDSSVVPVLGTPRFRDVQNPPETSPMDGQGWSGQADMEGLHYYNPQHLRDSVEVAELKPGSKYQLAGASKLLIPITADSPLAPGWPRKMSGEVLPLCYFEDAITFEPLHDGAPAFSLLPHIVPGLSAADIEGLREFHYSCAKLSRTTYAVNCIHPKFNCVNERGLFIGFRPGSYTAFRDIAYRKIPFRDCNDLLLPTHLESHDITSGEFTAINCVWPVLKMATP
ncbi:hypothetical protein CDD81_4892 [Ophiocordyceps australis]|uniref:Uncharacterized protein n=1 Tax=Ophiocordyceps australis TaxID=1399860 RepID=A0A2C5Y3S5_9HYPO|nr:hypothetical protein CDD81_4892 [Ophiocordyceps australis]